ncbi:MAG: rod shape-determining protein MreD [Clostridia bacterium]|nr:rod shape-determining protein MreD [Clostridia bacterium]
MRKFGINVALIFIALLVYFLQENFFSWFTIAGVMPNLFVMFTLFIGLFCGRNKGVLYGMIIGLILDIVVGNRIGIYAVTLGGVGLAAGIFAKNFSKDSKLTIMLMVAGLTAAFELITYLLNYFILDTNIEIFMFLKILIIEVVYNVVLTIIIYPLFRKFGYFIEHEYKGDQILTRYF